MCPPSSRDWGIERSSAIVSADARITRILRRLPLIVDDFASAERDRRLLGLLATAVVPTCLASWTAFLPGIWQDLPWLAVAGVVVLGAFQVLLAVRLQDRPETVPGLLLALHDVERAMDTERAAGAVARREAGHLIILQNWLIAVHSFHARAVTDAGRSPQVLVEGLMQVFPPDPRPLFGFTADDIWSFAVYLFDGGEQRLVCVWRIADERHRSQGVPVRTWAAGEGHVGQALVYRQGWAGHRGLVTPDVTAIERADQFEAPQPREYDADVYRSFASICFGGLDPEATRNGVVVGTSSRPGAFDNLSALPLRHLAAVLSTLAPRLQAFRT